MACSTTEGEGSRAARRPIDVLLELLNYVSRRRGGQVVEGAVQHLKVTDEWI